MPKYLTKNARRTNIDQMMSKGCQNASQNEPKRSTWNQKGDKLSHGTSKTPTAEQVRKHNGFDRFLGQEKGAKTHLPTII